jgi:ABC-2 type transport system ATP-binding protein
MPKSRDPSPEAAIEARGLTKTYAGSKKAPPKTALQGLDLVVPKGSMFGLLGPNGAGKSTFINILAGLVVKSGGEAFVWGHEVSLAPREAKAAIGVVPQEITADPFFTPFETLELHAGFYGVPKAERRTMEILDAVGLVDKKDAYVRTLSGGMKRRLMVAKALVHSPPVIVLDEPTAGVDVDLRRQLWDYVRRLNASGVVNQGALVACEPTGQILKRLDGKTLVITPQSPISEPPAGLEGLDAALRPGGELAVSYRSGQRSIEEILARVTAAGVAIKDLRTEEADLEDVFVALTTA